MLVATKKTTKMPILPSLPIAPTDQATDHDRFHLRRICYLLRTKKLLSTNPTVYDQLAELVSKGSAALEKLKLLSDREGIADQVKGRLQLLNEAKSRMLTARNRHRKLRRALAAVSQNDAQTNHLEHAEHLETAAILLLKKSDTLTQHVEMLLQQKRDNALQSEKIESMGERCALTLELSIKKHYIEHMLRSFKRTKELKAALDKSKILDLLLERDRIHCEMEDVEDQIAQVQRRLKIAGQRKEFP